MTVALAPNALRADFPGLIRPDGGPWHYLDTGATAQKPQVVIDATVRAAIMRPSIAASMAAQPT